jgi:hypothetical protein
MGCSTPIHGKQLEPLIALFLRGCLDCKIFIGIFHVTMGVGFPMDILIMNNKKF